MLGSKKTCEAFRDGGLVRTFDSVSAAARWLRETGQVAKPHLSTIIRASGTNRKPYGYTWRTESSFVDLTGRKWNHFKVVRFVGNSRWECVCDCGNTRILSRYSIDKKDIYSCGRHDCPYGYTAADHHRLEEIWNNLKRKCYNPKSVSYQYYGAKGIRICEQWSGFEHFAEWSLNHGYTETSFLDRTNANGDFSPENCRWLEPKPERSYYTVGNWKPVVRLDGRGKATSYRSITDAAEDLIDNGEGHKKGDLLKTIAAIDNALKRKSATSYGYVWEYADKSNS